MSMKTTRRDLSNADMRLWAQGVITGGGFGALFGYILAQLT